MKTNIQNEQGYVLISALLILVLLTIIGISAIQTSTTESKISFNSLIAHMNFYAAESGPQVAKLHLLDSDFLSEDDYSNPDWEGTDTFELPNRTEFTFVITHQLDSDGNVLRYGDSNGDYLWEINTTHGRPLEIVRSYGTHLDHEGEAAVEVRLIDSPPFITPESALWVDDPDAVDFKGNATVIGDSTDPSVCSDVPDVVHHLTPINPMDEPKHFGDEYVHESSGGMYPFSQVKKALARRADHIGTTFPTAIAEASTADDPVIIIIEGDLQINNEDLKVPAHGVLFVDGNLRINGNVEWNGLIVSTGNTSIGNGTADITGALVTGDSADVDIAGTITIQYDCNALANIYNNLSGYRMTSWKQI